eukprot:TRINITY_DN934_c0_g1_i1.p1 TRINITY_DN934_c0_g1~~TRINITY_DN934_c0_g1_i1.p1  ORF type:complete len:216 (+),score=45.49 TRINITY_DN934_c0_g1_i1:83-649(+)
METVQETAQDEVQRGIANWENEVEKLTSILEAYEPAENDPLNFETRKEMSRFFEEISSLFKIYQLKNTKQYLVMRKFVEDSKKREDEWKSLADLFTGYKTKMTKEILDLRKIVLDYKQVQDELKTNLQKLDKENKELKEHMVVYRDIATAMKLNVERKMHLQRITAEIESDEAKTKKILDDLARETKL